MTTTTIDVSNLSKAAVLSALYNASKQQGAGFFHTRGIREMTVEEAEAELAATGQSEPYFDYLHGRIMKVRIDGTNLDPWLFDRDNGQGAAAAAIARITSP